jgi:beta-glucuronidase
VTAARFPGTLLALALSAWFLLPIAARCEAARTDTLPLCDGWQFRFVGSDSGTGPAAGARSGAWERVTIPHCFPEDGGRNPKKGFGWYYRDVAIPAAFAGKDIAFESEGACLFAKVFIDGVTAGSGDFPYLPFSVDCTPFVAGKRTARIAVRVDNRLVPGRIPDDRALGWRIDGGMIRPLRMVARPRERIGSVDIKTFCRGADIFDLAVQVTAAHEKWERVELRVVPPWPGRPPLRVSFSGCDTTVQVRGVRPWTPDMPFRYRVSLIPFFHGKAGDTVSLLRGFCQLTADKEKLLLNGASCYLFGMGRHDVLGTRGPLLSREERRRDLCDLKALGVNFLRIAHFSQDRDIYELCDSLGLLVMDEMPAWKTDGAFLASSAGKRCGSDYLRAIIAAHGSYTCIGLWSIGNQLAAFKPSVAGFIAAAATAVRAADPSRLVTCCSYCYELDRSFPDVDVIAVNEYFGWELASLPMLGPMLDGLHAKWPGKPVIVSEFGAQSAFGLRNPHPRLAGIIRSMVAKDLSEDHQALFLGAHMDTILARRSYVNGMVVWAYADYLSDLHKARTLSMPIGLNGCGIVTRNRQRKAAWGVVHDRYAAMRRRFFQ